MDLLTRSKLEPLSACNGKGANYHKVYVDEVQDNTQAEIVLYFLAAGMNTQALFLAGDPAQSVVEGVDFRFEDVRSIVYKLSDGVQSIQRPIKLLTNYRSHSGILNCAAAILDVMFAGFPGSAKVLPRDAGLFNGPRPAYCTVHGANSLLNFLRRNQRIIVICPDDLTAQVEATLETHKVVNLVLGIRAAKGLEFQDIVLYDFFSNIPTADHKAWKSLLTDTAVGDSDAYKHPQIESQLKLLYTAITRSCNRLIFIESQNSPLVSTFFRWLKSRALAEPFVSTVSSESDEAEQFMTSDEWRVQGIEFALSAEGDNSLSFLRKALRCFDLAGDLRLKAMCQLQQDLERRMGSLLTVKTRETDKETLKLKPREELDLTALIARGFKAGLVDSATELCMLAAPVVSEELYFQQNVVSML